MTARSSPVCVMCRSPADVRCIAICEAVTAEGGAELDAMFARHPMPREVALCIACMKRIERDSIARVFS